MYSQSVTSKCGFLSEAFVCALFTVIYTGCNFWIQPIPFVWLFKWNLANAVSFVTLLSFLKRFNFGMKLQGSIIWYQALLFMILKIVISETCHSAPFDLVWGLCTFIVQSWTSMQYSQFSVISWYPRKTAHPFWQLLAVLSPQTLYIVETSNKFCILASSVVCGQGKGLGMCELKKKQKKNHKRKFVSRRLFIIVDFKFLMR